MTTIILEYIWIDGRKQLRSKCKTLHNPITQLKDIPNWNYDGSSTYQATVENSEMILQPVYYCKNPFIRDIESYLVLCATYLVQHDKLIPTETNHYHHAQKLFSKRLDLEPWFGIEQEYFMMKPNGTHETTLPPMFSEDKTGFGPETQGNYYCGVGTQYIQFRQLAEKHYKYCLYAGINISGINAEVAPNQWEYQVGPCIGITAGNQLWMSRYILHKLSEEFAIVVSFNPKPLMNPWNGSGLHINVSTLETRAVNGLSAIERYVELLKVKHAEHLAVYGDNSKRLTGHCETSDPHVFTCGYGNRGCSIRIPTETLRYQYGYFEDRRPASDADPYQATGILFKTCCL
jgi:glutamine synthetase